MMQLTASGGCVKHGALAQGDPLTGISVKHVSNSLGLIRDALPAGAVSHGSDRRGQHMGPLRQIDEGCQVTGLIDALLFDKP